MQIYIEFSENFSLPIQHEPQSMYWVRKQISMHCGIGICVEDDNSQTKVYFGHLSDEHNQVYVKHSLIDMLSVLPANDTIVIRSDNANHFKSAGNFSDLQDIANQTNSTVIRVYGGCWSWEM